MTFDEWWNTGILPLLPDDMNKGGLEAVKEIALSSWNTSRETHKAVMPTSVRHALEFRIIELEGYKKKHKPEYAPQQWWTEVEEIERFINRCHHDGGYGDKEMF